MLDISSLASRSSLTDEQIPEARSKSPLSSSVLNYAESAGILLLNPSDLVFESNAGKITYYDFVISATRQPSGNYQLYLFKFDEDTNLEWMEFTDVTNNAIASYNLPDSDLPMILVAILTWKSRIQKNKILCLVKAMDAECTQILEAIKKAAEKFRCFHHVVSINERKPSSSTRDYSPR